MPRSLFSLLERLSIGARIALGFGTLLVLLVAISIVNDRDLRGVQSNVATIRSSAASADALNSFAAVFLDARRLSDVYLNAPGAAQLVAARAAQTSVSAALNGLSDLIGADLGDLRPKVDSFKQSFEQLTVTMAGRQKALSTLTASGARLNNFGFAMVAALSAQNDPAAPAALRLNQSLQALFAASYRFALQASVGDADIMSVEADRVRDNLSILKDHPPVFPQSAALVQGVLAPAGKFLDAAATLQSSINARNTQANEINAIGTEIGDRIGIVRKHYLDSRDASVSDAGDMVAYVLIVSLAAAAFAVGLGIAMAFAVGTSISRLVARITHVMSTLAHGDLAVVVTDTDRRDEIGRMANALQVFKDGAIEKLRLGSETADTRRLSEEDRRNRELEKAEDARQDQIAIDAIGDGLRRLAGGDLVHRITTPFAPKTQSLQVDFNASVETLQTTMLTVIARTAAISAGTGEISTAADDLSRRTEQQAASLEETAAALDEITATVRKTATGSGHARRVVDAAKLGAEHSGQVVRQAIKAMSGIEKSSDQIGQIIGVIDEIAFQTNLLALNAGVEAARAGEAGRGFAVVASEVRGLAQRSAEAAKEINALIVASRAQVKQGVDLVVETGQSLDRIMTQVVEVNSIVCEIATASHEQATSLDQVNIAINQMDQVTQQNAAMVEESTAASHALAQETRTLTGLVGRFQVGGDPLPETRGRAHNPVRAIKRDPAPVLRTMGRAAAARKG